MTDPNTHLDSDTLELSRALDRLGEADRHAPDGAFESRLALATTTSLTTSAAQRRGLRLVGGVPAAPKGVRLGAGLRLAAAVALAATLLTAMLARSPSGGSLAATDPLAGPAVTDSEWSAIFGGGELDQLFADADILNQRILGEWTVDDALLDDQGAM